MSTCNEMKNDPVLQATPAPDTGSYAAPKGIMPLTDAMIQSTDHEVVPIPQKLALSIREAAAYSSIGINKIEELARAPDCPFVLRVGTRKLIKRKEFEDYISRKYII